MTLTRGIYSIQNGIIPVVVDLAFGGTANGTKVQGHQKYPFSSSWCLAQLWLVTPTGEADTFTLQNLAGGIYLDLRSGNSTDGNQLQGYQRMGNSQVWIIRQAGTLYRIQNKQSGTFVDLWNGGSVNGTEIKGWEGDWEDTVNTHQLWSFQSVSQTSTEIKKTLSTNPFLKGRFIGYQLDGIYWVLDKDLLKAIWTDANLGERKQHTFRPEIFDQDDFALVFKAQLAKWGSDNIRADGLNLLCGVMLGLSTEQGRGGQSYNFMLSSDFSTVMFFEPRSGQFLEDIGAQVVFF